MNTNHMAKALEESRYSILTDKFSIVFFELKKLKNTRKNKPVEVWLDLINAETAFVNKKLSHLANKKVSQL